MRFPEPPSSAPQEHSHLCVAKALTSLSHPFAAVGAAASQREAMAIDGQKRPPIGGLLTKKLKVSLDRALGAGSSRREIARDHDGCGVGTASLRRLGLVRRLQKQLVHNTQDLLVRLNHACGVEILADFAEHIAALWIDRTHGKGV